MADAAPVDLPALALTRRAVPLQCPRWDVVTDDHLSADYISDDYISDDYISDDDFSDDYISKDCISDA
jgi:hypothetical protein